MGMVRIEIVGSFGPKQDQNFTAEEGGHALAIARAIDFLSKQLPGAIRLDHKLHYQGEYPATPFGYTRTDRV
jgi:hypothetical protein